MPATVYLYSNTDYTKRLGKTSKAFNCVITKELMREHTLEFSVTNDNSFYRSLRQDGAFECDGQLFDLVDMDTESGESNITQISADHVSYRLSDYMIPDNYSFVGTLPQIVADILEQGVNINDEQASAMFSVGECYEGLGNVTYALIGQENITVRAALLGLTYLGVEVDFDNFTIHCPLRVGADRGVTFDFTTNLKRFRRRFERENGWTYEVDVADRGDIALGDDITVHDTFIGDDVKKRIISYSRCIDDPTKNAVTLGVFILDSASATVETGLQLNGLNSKYNDLSEEVDNSVKQGQQYNNVAITHELGFVSSNEANEVRVIANGTNCFAVQKKVNGTWVTMASASLDGFAAVRSDGKLRVLLNADDCLVVQKYDNGRWIDVTAVDTEGISAGKLTTPGSQYYGVIGGDTSEYGGFTLYHTPYDLPIKELFKIRYEPGLQKVVLSSLFSIDISSDDIFFTDGDGNKIGYSGNFPVGEYRIYVTNGLITNVEHTT